MEQRQDGHRRPMKSSSTAAEARSGDGANVTACSSTPRRAARSSNAEPVQARRVRREDAPPCAVLSPAIAGNLFVRYQERLMNSAQIVVSIVVVVLAAVFHFTSPGARDGAPSPDDAPSDPACDALLKEGRAL